MSSENPSRSLKVFKAFSRWIASLAILWAVLFALFQFFMPDVGFSGIVLIAIGMSIYLTIQLLFDGLLKAIWRGMKAMLRRRS